MMKVDWPAVFELPKKIGWRDRVIAFAIGAAYVISLLATARSLGFARDEGFYFRAAMDYARWFDLLFTHPGLALDRSAIDGAWGTNHEHPALMKSLFALSWMQLHERFHVFEDASTAFRFPAMCMAGMGMGITYLFGARAFSRRAGFIAAVLLGLMPNVFYHAHLAAFDVPIMSMWLLSIYVYWRSQSTPGGEGLAWALACGVVFGLTLETKHNAWILPAVFLPHALFVRGRSMARSLRRGLVQIPVNLVAMAVVGPLVFLALWPWMWSDTSARLDEYLKFHLNHEYYNIEYLGRNYFGPPSPPSYAPVMILATVPTITLLLFGVGMFDRCKVAARRVHAWFVSRERSRDPRETDLLLALALAAPLAVFFLPKTPIFGGTKHWLPAYPFLVLFAGRGFDILAAALTKAIPDGWSTPKRRLAHGALYASVLLAPLAVTAHSHPFGLSTYVPFVGGTAGGADLGLNRQFWGFTTESVGPYLAANAPRGATVFIHDTAWDSWARLLDEGRMRRDLHAVGSPTEAQFSLVQHELHMAEVDHQIWIAYGSPAPAYVLTHDGVPIVSVYKRR